MILRKLCLPAARRYFAKAIRVFSRNFLNIHLFGLAQILCGPPVERVLPLNVVDEECDGEHDDGAQDHQGNKHPAQNDDVGIGSCQ